MPKKRLPSTLRNACLQRVARSLDKFWFSDFDSHFSDLPRLLYVIGPFEHFTGDLIQSLLDILTEEKLLKRKHFHFLLQSAVNTLDLSRCGSIPNHDSITKILIGRCTRLTQLNLKSLNQISARLLADLVTALPGLKSLNLCSTKCNDQVLSLIGYHSIELRDLDISSTPVSDSGAFSMCPGFPVAPLKPGCPNLIKLDITGTRISSKGAGMLLDRLTNLQYLHFADVCGLVEQSFQRATSSTDGDDNVPSFDLRVLTTSGLKTHSVTDLSIQLSCIMCPSVTEVRLFCGITDDNISHLANLKSLRILELANVHQNDVTFEGGLLYVLREIGNTLLTLSLYEINNLDLWLLALACPHIQKLSISVTSYLYDHATFYNSTVSADDRGKLFAELKVLKIFIHTETENFPSSCLQTMLSNAKHLKDVHLINMRCFTIDLLQRVLQVNMMSNLNTLRLDKCNEIDPDGIMLLLSGDNSLYRIELLQCHHITLQDVGRLKKYAADMLYDVEIVWQ